MNDTIHPADAVDTSGTGAVLLDMSTAPLGDTTHKYLDTLRLDYAFIIALQPVHRNMQVPAEAFFDEPAEWNYFLYPNPASDQFNIVLPDNAPADIVLYDLSGRRLLSWANVPGPRLQFPAKQLARGVYYVRVTSGGQNRTKPLMIR